MCFKISFAVAKPLCKYNRRSGRGLAAHSMVKYIHNFGLCFRHICECPLCSLRSAASVLQAIPLMCPLQWTSERQWAFRPTYSNQGGVNCTPTSVPRWKEWNFASAVIILYFGSSTKRGRCHAFSLFTRRNFCAALQVLFASNYQRGGAFQLRLFHCIKKTTGSAGGSKKL